MKILPDNMDRISSRRKRTVLTAKQHRILTNFFSECAFPDSEQRARLGRHLEMTPRTVQIWFQNQRQKVRSTMGDKDSLFDYEENLYDDYPEIPSSRQSNNKSLVALANAACIEYNKKFGIESAKSIKAKYNRNNINYED